MEETTFEVTVRPEDVRDAEPAMVSAWIRQNRQVEQAIELAAPLFCRRNLYRALRTLAPLALLMSLLLAALEFNGSGNLAAARGPLLLAVALAGLTWPLLRFTHEQATAGFHHLTDRLIRRNVRKTVERTARRAPFEVTYRLEPSSVAVSVDRLNIRKTITAENTALAIRTGTLYLFFRRALAQRWSGIVYVGSPEQDQAFRDFLQQHQIKLVSDSSERLVPAPVAEQL